MRDARRTVLTSMEGMGSFTLPPEAVAILSNFKMASFQVNPGLQPSHTSSVVSSLVDGWMAKNRSLCERHAALCDNIADFCSTLQDLMPTSHRGCVDASFVVSPE